MRAKRNCDDNSSAASDGAAASPPIVAKVKVEGARAGATADTAISILISPPVVGHQGSSSSSSSSHSSSTTSTSSAADAQLLKRARVEGRNEGRKELSTSIAKNLICPITHLLMAFPVIADDDCTYEKSAILKWLETHTTSPLDPSITIREETLRKSRAVSNMIKELVKSNDIDDETKEAWQEKRDEPQRLFDEGRILAAAKLGHVAAMGQMATNHLCGLGITAVDSAKAFEFATKAAKEGDGQGMSVLGACYSMGCGVDVDEVAGLKWLEEAAKKGEFNSMYNSGAHYSVGEGCVKDDKKAAEYFRSASERGHQVATNALGNCYYEGAGVPKNLETARTFFKKAADLKNPDGDVNLGAMMICGEGGESEVGKGFTLIEKAAEDGNKYAVAHLKEIKKVVKKWTKTGVDKLGTLL